MFSFAEQDEGSQGEQHYGGRFGDSGGGKGGGGGKAGGDFASDRGFVGKGEGELLIGQILGIPLNNDLHIVGVEEVVGIEAAGINAGAVEGKHYQRLGGSGVIVILKELDGAGSGGAPVGIAVIG